MPGPQGVVGWVDDGLSASALVDPVRMPLPDASIDRVLAVHALETVDSPVELLHEVWRILVPGGRVVVAAPNRRGLWARMDTTPFGQGQPFSRSQLKALMRETWFAPTAWAETLYVPPLRSELLLRTALAWERAGTSLGVPFAGLHVVEAEKQFRQPVALARARARRAARLPVFVPAPAPLAAPPAAGSARQVLTLRNPRALIARDRPTPAHAAAARREPHPRRKSTWPRTTSSSYPRPAPRSGRSTVRSPTCRRTSSARSRSRRR